MILLLEKEKEQAYKTYMKEKYIPKPSRITRNTTSSDSNVASTQ